jgi:hypothetical protein
LGFDGPIRDGCITLREPREGIVGLLDDKTIKSQCAYLRCKQSKTTATFSQLKDLLALLQEFYNAVAIESLYADVRDG